MALFGKKRKKYSKDVLLGVNIPPWVSSYLNLYVTAKHTTKSDLLRQLLQQWFDETYKTDTEETLIYELIAEAKDQWRLERKINPELTAPEFRRIVLDTLLHRGIPQTYAYAILRHIKDRENYEDKFTKEVGEQNGKTNKKSHRKR